MNDLIGKRVRWLQVSRVGLDEWERNGVVTGVGGV